MADECRARNDPGGTVRGGAGAPPCKFPRPAQAQRKPVDVPMLSLMADQRAHRRADAKLDRMIEHGGSVESCPRPASSAEHSNAVAVEIGSDLGMPRRIVFVWGVLAGLAC